MAFELFTSFPYFKVGNRIFDDNHYTVSLYKKDWPNNKITQLWYYYEQGLINGDITPVDNYKSNDSLYYLEERTPYHRAHIMYWLRAVQDLAVEGKIDAEYYTGKKVAANPFEKIKNVITGEFKDVYGTTKTMTFVALGGMILFFFAPTILKVSAVRTVKRKVRRKIRRKIL